jgi:DNA-directed RNA polymerase specialized sigma24 family protein
MSYESDDRIWEEVMEFAAIAAARVYRRFGKWASRDDMQQAALEYAWRKKDLVREFLNREGVERKRGEAALLRTLSRAAERYARKEKAARSGYNPSDEQFYTDNLIEGLIQAWGWDDAQLANQVLDPAEMGGRRKKLVNEGNTIIAMLADVDRAMNKLDPRTRGVLYARVVESRTLVDVAAAWEITPQRVDQIHRRGLNQMVEFLGGERP